MTMLDLNPIRPATVHPPELDSPEGFEMKLYWEMTEARLAEIYRTARREGVIDQVAFDAAVNEECFLLFARRVEVFGAGFDDRGRPLGFFYLNNFEGATARLHFCLFEAGRPRRLELGRRVLDWCFETFEFKALLGLVPTVNPAAIDYARRMGGRESALIPGLCWIERLKRTVDAVQFIFERSDAHGRNVQ